MKKFRRSVGIRIVKKYKELDKIPDIKNFTHFINCEISPDICPLYWEELEKVDDEDSKRYCKVCRNYVYRIDDEKSLEYASKTNECLAISVDLLEKLNGKWDKKIIENYEKRLLVSKLFLFFKTKYYDLWKNFKKEHLNYNEILEKIFKIILKEEIDFKFFIENNVDLIEIMDLISNYFDENLKIKYKEKRDELIFKINGLKK
jgi:hypothetical protein